MNRFKIPLLFAGTIFALFACSNQNNTSLETSESIESQKEEIYESAQGDDHYLRQVEREEPTWAGVSYASSTGSVSSDYIAEIDDAESLQFIVEEMIEGSERQAGIVDVTQPYYDMKIEYSDGSEELFHLWVTKDELIGTIMDTENTHFIYTFSDTVSEQFLSLLPEDAILDSPVQSESSE